MDANSPYAEGSTVSVLGQGSLTRTGYTFAGWASSKDGVAAYRQGQQLMISDNMTLYAVWTQKPITATEKYTVVYEPGRHGTFSTQTSTNLKAGDDTPAAPIITGEKGWTFKGWSPQPGKTVTKNATYTAQWQRVETNETNPETNADMVTVTFVDWDGTVLKTEQMQRGKTAVAPSNPSKAGAIFLEWDASFTNVTSDLTVTARYIPVTTIANTSNDPDSNTDENNNDENNNVEEPTDQQILETLTEEYDVPTYKIMNSEVPLEGGPLSDFVWALINLILAALGIVLAILTLLIALIRRKQAQDKSEEDEAETGTESDEEQPKRYRLIWLITALLMSIAGLILFILTEDMTRLMVLTDKWTIGHAIILIIEIICILFSFKRSKQQADEDSSKHSQ
jgi:uncharacterized repeat protein (TIGR02543 family)